MVCDSVITRDEFPASASNCSEASRAVLRHRHCRQMPRASKGPTKDDYKIF